MSQVLNRAHNSQPLARSAVLKPKGIRLLVDLFSHLT
jgi:hypothetical protein